MKESTGVSEYCLSDEDLKRYQTGDGIKGTGIRRYKKQAPIRWYQFPPSVLDQAFATTEARHNAWPVVAVLMALFELWFTDPDHHNPVRLTSYNLQRFGLTRKQKCRALKILEMAKVVSVERRPRKNPIVTLSWQLLRH